MKTAHELLAEWNRLDRAAPVEEAPVAPEAEPETEEADADQQEAPVEEMPADEPAIDETVRDADPESPQVLVDKLPVNDEPSVAVESQDDPVATEKPAVTTDDESAAPETPIDESPPVMEVGPAEGEYHEEGGGFVYDGHAEPAVESQEEPSIVEPTVDATDAPQFSEDEVAETDDVPDEPAAPVEAMVEPSVPNEPVDTAPTVAGAEPPVEPVGFQGDVHHPDITIEQFNAGELDDTPSMDDVDRQVARQIQHEQMRGDDLARQIHEDLKPLFDGLANETIATVHDVVEMEALTLSMMRE